MHHRHLVATLTSLGALLSVSSVTWAQLEPGDPFEDEGDDVEDEDDPAPGDEDLGEDDPGAEAEGPVASTAGADKDEPESEKKPDDPKESEKSTTDAAETDEVAEGVSSASFVEEESSESTAPTEDAESADESASDEVTQAVFVDAPEKGPSLTPFRVTTSTKSRFEYRQNYDSLGVSGGRTTEGDLVVFRARLGFQTNPIALTDGADVLVQFSPQASGNYGQNGTIGEANLGIYEGYFKLRTKRLDFQLGRSRLDYGDSLVIGDLDWNEKGRAFDGMLARYKMDRGYVDFIGTQTREGQVGVTPVADESGNFLGGDHYFWGVYSGFGEYVAEELDLELYALGLSTVARTRETETASGGTETVKWEGSNLFTLGTRVKHGLGIFFYRVEAGLQFGTSAPLDDSDGSSAFNPQNLEARDTFAYQVDGELGVEVGSRTKFSLGGAYASGDDVTTLGNEGYTELYPTAHKFLGLTDVIGARSNIISGNAKVKRGVIEGLTLFVDAHVFARPEEGAPGALDKGFAGVEIDTQLEQRIGKYVQLRGLYGMFIPQSGHYASDKLVSYSEVEAAFVF